MVRFETDSLIIKNDRFELMAILRTLIKEKHRLNLGSEQGFDFEVLRLESGRINLIPLQDPATLPDTLDLIAEGREAKIIFSTRVLASNNTDSGIVIVGDIPDEFQYYQRRINLRVPLPIWKHFTLTLPVSGLTVPPPFIIYDFSVGGVGVYTQKPLSEKIKVGSVFKKAQLSLGEYGEFKANVEIIAINDLEDELPEHPGYQQRMSVKFSNLSLITQRNFQKIAYAFEVNFKRKK